MLRSAATPQGPSTRGEPVIIETNHPHTDTDPGEPGRTVDHHEPELTFELAEAPSIKPNSNSRLASLSNESSQQSAPSFSPLRPRTPQSAAGTPNRTQPQDMALTGDSRTRRRSQKSPARAAGRLGDASSSANGTAAAAAAAAPTTASTPNTTPASKQGGAPPESTPNSTNPPRLGFLASLTTRITGQPQQQIPQIEDYCNFDVEAALFPSSNPSDRDAFSPAAFKNLQTNAVGLLHKMQDAYRQQAVTIREFEAEKGAQEEEAEETELRVKHFKNQLENMAAKAAEQEKVMQQLVAELHAERKGRAEDNNANRMMARDKLLMSATTEGSVVSEDLGVDEADERRKWRKSDGTFRSELSTDTDAESAESASIFSRCRSPTTTTTITETDCDAATVSTPPTPQQSSAAHHATAAKPATPSLIVPSKSPRSSQQLTTFQKLVRGISGEAKEAPSCQNCRGQDSSVAWDTVSLLRDENRGLKHRVAELEVAVEGALDVVDGVGL